MLPKKLHFTKKKDPEKVSAASYLRPVFFTIMQLIFPLILHNLYLHKVQSPVRTSIHRDSPLISKTKYGYSSNHNSGTVIPIITKPSGASSVPLKPICSRISAPDGIPTLQEPEPQLNTSSSFSVLHSFRMRTNL